MPAPTRRPAIRARFLPATSSPPFCGRRRPLRVERSVDKTKRRLAGRTAGHFRTATPLLSPKGRWLLAAVTPT